MWFSSHKCPLSFHSPYSIPALLRLDPVFDVDQQIYTLDFLHDIIYYLILFTGFFACGRLCKRYVSAPPQAPHSIWSVPPDPSAYYYRTGGQSFPAAKNKPSKAGCIIQPALKGSFMPVQCCLYSLSSAFFGETIAIPSSSSCFSST